jgi:hypothetical protein
VNQYGQAFTGSPSSGSNVANAVTNDAVRAAEAAYLAALGRQIDGHRLLAVREGGGPSGELRYPRADYQGAINCWWAYDESTQEKSPVPGWKPGTGTVEQARAFLAAYNGALADYGAWLNAQLRAAFDTTVLMLLPGWGQRPGVIEEVVATRLQGSYDEFNEGLDWPDLLGRIAEPQHSVAYTTYLDAPSFGSSPQRQDPASYLATIAPPLGFRLGGENTGNGTRQTLKLALDRARDLGYFIVNWMDERQLVASSGSSKAAGPTFADLERAIAADLRG